MEKKQAKKFTPLAKKLVIKRIDNTGFKNKFVKIHFVFSWVAIVALASIVYLGASNSPSQDEVLGAKTENVSESQDDQIKQITDVVSIADPNPTVFTVKDMKILSEDAFYKNAQVADKVFVFNQDQLAIIYRPSLKKIINMSHLATPSSTPTPTRGPTPNKLLKK